VSNQESGEPLSLHAAETAASGVAFTPMIKGMLIGLTIFFFLASMWQLYYLHQRIADTPDLHLNEMLQKSGNKFSNEKQIISLLELQSRVALEEYALKRRYHQGNVLLMSRIWVSYLSFVTGMILCLVGASFILGRIQEPASKINADSKVVKFSVVSSSPGIILAALGTALIMTSILTNHRIAVEDASVYLRSQVSKTVFDPVLPSEHVESTDGDGTTAAEELDNLLK